MIDEYQELFERLGLSEAGEGKVKAHKRQRIQCHCPIQQWG